MEKIATQKETGHESSVATNPPLPCPKCHRCTDSVPWFTRLVFAGFAFQLSLGLAWYSGALTINKTHGDSLQSTVYPTLHECRPPLPPLIHLSPDGFKHHPSIVLAARSLQDFLSNRTTQGDIDSLTLAVVTPHDVVFQQGYGVRRANETHSGPNNGVDENTIYRIASTSKMFAALEMFILKERAVLSLDDHVDKFLPGFTCGRGSWQHYLNITGRNDLETRMGNQITLRQLASHLSGIGRDDPPTSLNNWPNLQSSELRVNSYIPDREEVLASIAELPLVAPGYTIPVYSNTGYNVLSYAIVAADNSAPTYADLVHRDIFEPLGLSSSFNVTPENVDRVAVSSVNPGEVDIDYTDSGNAARGQFSSLSDLVKVMQDVMLRLDKEPSGNRRLISGMALREWLRTTMFSLDDNNLTELGMPWEIIKLRNSHVSPRRYFGKVGNSRGFHSHFIFDPTSSFGVVALMTGSFFDPAQITLEAIRRFQPAFDHIEGQLAERLYAGRWLSTDTLSEALIRVQGQSVWVEKLVVNGTDIFAQLAKSASASTGGLPIPQAPKVNGGTERYALWWTGREGEFRLPFGRSGLNGEPYSGCEPYWFSTDIMYSRGAPIDLILFEGHAGERRLIIPSTQTTLFRVHMET